MQAACASEASAESCAAPRWPRERAVRLRGTSDCPPGARRRDAGLCIEGGEAYGPFFKEAVALCEKETSDESACSWNRWEAKFAIGIYGRLRHRPQTSAPPPSETRASSPAGGSEPTPICTLPRSRRLSSGLFNPMPGGTFAGYVGDTGLDIAGDHMDVFAVGNGVLDYSERGHTSWTTPPDTPNSIRLKLDAPLAFAAGRRITHIWYTHMSKLQYEAPPEGSVHVEGGWCLGISGLGNNNPHLHIGFLLDDNVDQESPSTYLSYSEIMRVLGEGFRSGVRLPVP